MSKELRDQDYLEHIQDAIGKIRCYVAGKSEANFAELLTSGPGEPLRPPLNAFVQ
ncbi:hypothetical protein [Verrucomicrobium sp. 3C]|uniref:hypothetical protein n=1 Tax=Verrucomicrobium sp. 3C TaxID=1134055 RepID=UPI000381EBA3|nr:hypothetical protein [Verrucomicrobium sp. 3C]